MTPHNSAASGDIAPSVLLPGDPLRAKYVAERYLDNVRQVTAVRNMLGFTGEYHGKPVTVMGSGMGGPSAGIYAFELFTKYNAKRIIRIGTGGGLQSYLKPGDLVFALTACTDSNYAYQYQLPGTYAPSADFTLLRKASNAASRAKFRFYAGSVFSSDMFSDYNALGARSSWKPWADMGCIVQDMETYALYCTAAYTKKKALSIITHTDSCVTGASLALSQRTLSQRAPSQRTPSQRESALEPMFLTALACI